MSDEAKPSVIVMLGDISIAWQAKCIDLDHMTRDRDRLAAEVASLKAVALTFEARVAELERVLRPIAREIREREEVMHDSWNPDAHVELTLSIAECRGVIAALAATATVPSEGGGR